MFDCLVYCRGVSNERVSVFDCLVYYRWFSSGREVMCFIVFTAEG